MNIALNDSPKGRVLYLLRGAGGGTAQDVADALGVTVPAARRHLGDLLEAGLIEARIERQSGRGRPQHIFALTVSGEAVFPKRYAELCGDILQHVQSLYGDGAILEVLSARNVKLMELWRERVQGSSVAQKLECLVAVLNEIGYQASIEIGEHGELYLLEGNCPSLEVAKEFGQLCRAEGELYEQLLGAHVVRDSQISTGASVCRYRVLEATLSSQHLIV